MTTRPSRPSTARATAARRRQELYDRPVADMPAAEENDYDYSHFNYLNDQFEENYEETLQYAKEYYVDNLEEDKEERVNNDHKEVAKDDVSKDKSRDNFNIYKSENGAGR